MKAFGFLIAVGVLVIAAPVRAQEPAELFLTRLMEKGYFDLAITYLDDMETGRIAPEDFRRQIPLKRAAILVQSAKEVRNNDEASVARFAEAERILKDFSETAESRDDRSQAAETLAELLFGQAQIHIRRIESPRFSEAVKKDSIENARTKLEACLSAFETARKLLAERLTEMKDGGSRVDRAIYDKLKASYTNIRLRKPIVVEYLADTWPEGDPKRGELLAEAEAAYIKVMEDYRTYAAGLDACLYAARCRQKMNNDAGAIELLETLLALDNRPELMGFKRNAAVAAIQSIERIEPYDYERVIQRMQPMLATLSPSDLRHPDWTRVQLELSKALWARAAYLTDNNAPNAEIRQTRELAEDLARSVARIPGPVQDRARDQLAEWNVRFLQPTETDPNTLPPKDFVDARTRAVDLIGQVELYRQSIEDLEKKISDSPGDQDVAGLQSEIDTQKKQLDDLGGKTLDMLILAMKMVPPDADRREINQLRYLQSRCYFSMGKYIESALIGEFLVDRYSQVEWSKQASTLVINSYALLYRDASEDSRQYELEKLQGVARKVISIWPESPEATHAAKLSAQVALQNDNVARAEEMSERLGSDAGALSLQLANRKYRDLIRSRSGKSRAELDAEQSGYEATLAEVRTLLENGLENISPDAVSLNTVQSSVLLANLLIDAGDAGMAVNWLERPGSGPLNMVRNNHPAFDDPRFGPGQRRSAIRSGLLAYLGSLPTTSTPELNLDKTRELAQLLEKELETASLEEAARERKEMTARVTAILQEILDSPSTVGAPKSLAAGLVDILKSLAGDSNDAPSLISTAKALIMVADSIGPDDSASAKPIYEAAVDLAEAARTAGFGEGQRADSLALENDRLLGLAQRGAGQWEDSIATFTDLLTKRSSLLRAQMNAAETLQMKGMATSDIAAMEAAIAGTSPVRDSKTRRMTNAIWGWRRLVMETQRNAEFREVHDRSMLGFVECNFELAVMKKSPDTIRNISIEIDKWRTRDPELGGESIRARVEELEQKMGAFSDGK